MAMYGLLSAPALGMLTQSSAFGTISQNIANINSIVLHPIIPNAVSSHQQEFQDLAKKKQSELLDPTVNVYL